jgi:hypothetical protein
VPVHLTIASWLMINVGLAVASMLMLVVPSHFVTRISPSEAMRRD